MERKRRLSRADVAALGFVMLVTGMVVPLLAASSRELANRSNCAANLRGLEQSCIVYAQENNLMYPYIGGTSATTYDATTKPAVGKNTPDDTIVGIYKDQLLGNNPMAPLWLLVLTGQCAPKQFICRSDAFAGEPAAVQKGKDYYQNFQTGKDISYSVTYMWQEDGNNKVQPAPIWRDTTDSSLPIMSDMAPYLSPKAAAGETTTRPAATAPSRREDVLVLGKPEEVSGDLMTNSANHKFDGQNVVFADAHCEFDRRPDVGQNQDNIWAMSAHDKNEPGTETAIEAGKLPGKLTATVAPFDTVMVPMRNAKGDLR